MTDQDASHTFAKMITRLTYDDLPIEVIDVTKKSILDTIGVILAASGLSAEPREIIKLVVEQQGKKESSILGYGHKVPCTMAAFTNGAMAHAMDFDDVGYADGTAWGHIGITTVPPALAVSERIGNISGKEFLTAVALGNEMMYRMGLAAIQSRQGRNEWFLTPVLGVFSAAAASSKLLGLSEQQMIHAFGIALSQAAGSKELGLAQEGTLRALYGACPAQAGILSSLMAQRGITATQNSLEGKAGLFTVYFHGEHDASIFVDDLGTTFHSKKIGFKRWCTCAHSHVYIESMLQLAETYDLVSNDIERITVFTDDYMQNILCEPFEEKRRPHNSIAAKFSIPFTMAAALVRRHIGLRDFTSEGLKDSEVLDLAQKVITKVHSDVGRVCIETTDGKTYENRVLHPSGSFQNPMTDQQLEDKFEDCAAHAIKPLDPKDINKVIELINNLEHVSDVREIIQKVA